MPDGDILAQLLPTLLGGGAGGGGGGNDSSTIGAMKAIQGSDFLQGVPSQSGPIGQISQAIMPLLTSKIYGQQAEQDHNAKITEHLIDIFKLSNAIDDRKLKQLELQAKEDPSGQLHKVLEVVRSFRHEGGGTSGMGDMRLSTKVGDTTISMGGEKAPSTKIGLLEAAQAGDPKAAETLKLLNADADTQSLRMTEQAQRLTDLRSKDAEVKAAAKPAPKSRVYYDPMTNKRISNPTMGEVKEQDLKDLSGQEAYTVTQSSEALSMLKELEDLSNKLLPDYDKTANTLSGIFSVGKAGADIKRLRATGDPDVKRFDVLKSLSRFPIVNALQRSSRLPQTETDAIKQINVGDFDTKQGASAAIDQFRNIILKNIDAYGLNSQAMLGEGKNPSTIADQPPVSAHGGPALDFDNAPLRKAFENIKVKYPKMTASEMADFYSSHGDPGR